MTSVIKESYEFSNYTLPMYFTQRKRPLYFMKLYISSFVVPYYLKRVHHIMGPYSHV